MKKALLGLATLALYLLHQDVWFWRSARPFLLGFLPVGLAYHALLPARVAPDAAAGEHAWPAQLERETDTATNDTAARDPRADLRYLGVSIGVFAFRHARPGGGRTSSRTVRAVRV
jgi:hypothetical protein